MPRFLSAPTFDGRHRSHRTLHAVAAVTSIALLGGCAASGNAGADDTGDGGAPDTVVVEEEFPRQLGSNNERIRYEDDGRVLLWALGEPDSDDAEWYDFTGAPMAPEALQYGIGKDRIRAIDDPVFVAADDPRLLSIPPSPYRNEPVEATDDIMVIGYMQDDEPRAYPTALLDRHEIVNDEFKGKPVSVGW